MKGGIGTFSIKLPNGLTVAAIVAVNCVGDVIDRKTGRPWTFGVLGILQVAGGWASLTSEHYTIVVDRGDAAHEADVMLITTDEGKAYPFAVEPRNIRITSNLR